MTASRRLRVAMYTASDPDHDTRVLREADTLAAAGHDVILLARVRVDNAVPEDSRRPSGARVVRIPRDPGWSVRGAREKSWTLYPWRARTYFIRRLALDLRSGPAGWFAAAIRGFALLASFPWVAFRLAGWAVLDDRMPAPLRADQLVYVRTMKRSLERWLEVAPTVAPGADVHHGHDFTGLWAAVRAAERGRGVVVYDSHEYYPESGRHARQGWFAKEWLRRRERSLSRHAVALVTVNRTLEQLLQGSLGFERTVVVHNAPPRWTPPEPAPDLLRQRLNLPATASIVLYHGGLTEVRGLLPLCEAMCDPSMGTTHLVFLGTGPLRDELRRRAADPRCAGRIHVLDPVPPEALADWVASADVGVMPNLPVTANERLSTPNKLFESMAVGLPVVSSDFPERRRIIMEDPGGPLGAVCDSTKPESIAAAIRSILDLDQGERDALRRRILRAAHERWNWETESERLLSLYEELAAEARA